MNFKNLLIILATAIGVFSVNLDISIVNIAIPTLNSYFKTATFDTAKIVLSYLLSLSGFLLIFGFLGDKLGCNNIFILGNLIFMIASFLCAISNTLFELISFRFLQGIGGAMITATYGAQITCFLPSNISGRAFGIITAIGGIGFALGLPIGGYIVEHYNWHWLFLINIPICTLTILISLLTLKFNLLQNLKQNLSNTLFSFDYKGTFYYVIFLSALIYVLNQGKVDGWFSTVSIICYVLFITFLILFIINEKKVKYPIFNFSLILNEQILKGLLSTLVVVMLLDGLSFTLPLFFQYVKNYSPLHSGYILMIFPLTSVIFSPIAGILCDKIGALSLVKSSVLVIFISTLFFYNFNILSSFGFIIFTLIIFGIGLSTFFPSATTLVLSNAPQNNESLITAIYSSITNLGSILGVAIFELIFSLKTHLVNVQTINYQNGFQSAVLFGSLLCFIIVIYIFYKQHKNTLQTIK